MPVAATEWEALSHERFKAWIETGGARARHAVIAATGKSKSTVSTWVLGRSAPSAELQQRIIALMQEAPAPDDEQRSLPLERQRAAQRNAGLATRTRGKAAQSEIERCVEKALGKFLGTQGASFGGAPVLGIVPIVLTIRVEDSRSGADK